MWQADRNEKVDQAPTTTLEKLDAVSAIYYSRKFNGASLNAQAARLMGTNAGHAVVRLRTANHIWQPLRVYIQSELGKGLPTSGLAGWPKYAVDVDVSVVGRRRNGF
jgi:hypothetical protein